MNPVGAVATRQPDTAPRVVLTDVGARALADASETYEAEVSTVLEGAFSPDDQQHLHQLVTRLLVAADDASPA
jgi:hypothetical protein